jgi:protein TonB
MNKNDVLSNGWCNIIFQDRNKNYGAFQLRKIAHTNELKGIMFSILSATLILCFPFVIALFDKPVIDVPDHVFEFADIPPQKIEVSKPHKASSESFKQKKSNENTIPVITDDPQKNEIENQEQINLSVDSNFSDKYLNNNEKEQLMIASSDSVDDKIYPPVGIEKVPEFPGGEEALKQFLHKHIVFPSLGFEHGKSGMVYISFLINKEGIVSEIEVLKGIEGEPSFENEAIRVVRLLPVWKPGRQNGQVVNVRLTLPVNFQLKNSF